MTAEIAASPLRSVGRPVVDVEAAAAGVEDLMRALGMDTEDPGLLRTPSRVANAYAEMLAPREVGLTTFPHEEGYDELVGARAIPPPTPPPPRSASTICCRSSARLRSVTCRATASSDCPSSRGSSSCSPAAHR